MPKTDSPCSEFSPGRSLPLHECECGWMRIDHKKPEEMPIPLPMAAEQVKEVATKLLSETCDKYRAILIQIGELFGQAAYVNDVGTQQPEMNLAKLPDLVKELLAVKGFKSARIPKKAQTVYPDSEQGESPKKE